MSIRIVRLGTPRAAGEGVRLGTVRRPPRGVPKAQFASGNWYDVWYPNLSPSVETMKLALGTHKELDVTKASRDWALFTRLFRKEMSEPDTARTLDMLAALSHGADFSLGCYCEEEGKCHRSVLRSLLSERGASIE
ncbi:DUF488 domain-containing protein [Ottowia thiooxydans]|uniref:Uncharacterized protein YeaO (DUF488 family) n=1 Tax=Ottowia thiooxydans TaxID=219182 RepID=A0ABV2Q9T0_9BURK